MHSASRGPSTEGAEGAEDLGGGGGELGLLSAAPEVGGSKGGGGPLRPALMFLASALTPLHFVMQCVSAPLISGFDVMLAFLQCTAWI